MAALDNSQTDRRAAVPEWLRAGESRLRLQTIVRLRWLAVLGQSLTVIGAYWVLGIDLPIGGCLAVIALSAWLNVALRIRFPASQRLKSNYAFMMLGYDILQLAALLYLTGGLENPFAFLLIAPVSVSASTLPLRITVALGVLAIGAATLLTTFHHPLPWFGQGALVLPFPYVMGVWAAVVSGILFIGFYSWRTAEEGRRMAEALAAAEMVLAREQKLSALDGLAAAAAHGLGTPLATIAVVTKELLRDAQESDPHYEDLLLVRAQAERCREILKELAGRGEELDIIVSRMPVSHLMEEVVTPHRLLAVPIEVRTGPLAGIEPCSPRARSRWRNAIRASSTASAISWRMPSTSPRPRSRSTPIGRKTRSASSSPMTVKASRLTCWSSLASPSSPRGPARAGATRRRTSISAWASASSSPRPCLSDRARNSSWPTGQSRRAAPW